MSTFYIYSDYLAHHGILGQKWGVRRYQNKDGSLTSKGRDRYNKSKEKIDFMHHTRTGQTWYETRIPKNTTFKRIQISDVVENYEFYANHEKGDIDHFSDKFAKNLQRRKISKGGDDIYRVSLKANKDIKIPSINKCSNILADKLLTDKRYRKDVERLMEFSANWYGNGGKDKNEINNIFRTAGLTLKYFDPSHMDTKQRQNVYTALNLGLVFHNTFTNSIHQKFYDELRSEGYGAILDINDAHYSNLVAKHPLIVIDTSAVDHVKTEHYDKDTGKYTKHWQKEET